MRHGSLLGIIWHFVPDVHATEPRERTCITPALTRLRRGHGEPAAMYTAALRDSSTRAHTRIIRTAFCKSRQKNCGCGSFAALMSDCARKKLVHHGECESRAANYIINLPREHTRARVYTIYAAAELFSTCVLPILIAALHLCILLGRALCAIIRRSHRWMCPAVPFFARLHCF